MKAFTRTVELNSMSGAAKELHMTVSAVSQQLQRLEKDNGIALFHRNTRTLTLTEAGKVFYQSCLDMLSIASRNQEQWEALTKTPQGQIKLIAPVGFGGGLLSEPLKKLQQEFEMLNTSRTKYKRHTTCNKSQRNPVISIPSMFYHYRTGG